MADDHAPPSWPSVATVQFPFRLVFENANGYQHNRPRARQVLKTF